MAPRAERKRSLLILAVPAERRGKSRALAPKAVRSAPVPSAVLRELSRFQPSPVFPMPEPTLSSLPLSIKTLTPQQSGRVLLLGAYCSFHSLPILHAGID